MTVVKALYKNGTLVNPAVVLPDDVGATWDGCDVGELPPPPAPVPYVPPTDDEDIAAWVANNKWLAAFITALNRPVGHVKAFPIGGSLTSAQIAAILKANKA